MAALGARVAGRRESPRRASEMWAIPDTEFIDQEWQRVLRLPGRTQRKVIWSEQAFRRAEV
jgi:hypothetical protein